jgi:predicted acyltransferase
MTQTIARQRLCSLDALRGFDMFWIMGSDEIVRSAAKATDSPFMITISDQMEHPAWNGFHFYDLIFPLFLFIAGVATPYSVGKKLETGNSKQKLLLRIITRGLILVFIGIIYNNHLQIMPISQIRFGSVLGHIGVAYVFANIIYLYTNQKDR